MNLETRAEWTRLFGGEELENNFLAESVDPRFGWTILMCGWKERPRRTL